MKRILVLAALLLLTAAGCFRPPKFTFNGTPFSINPDIQVDTLNGAFYNYNGRGLFAVGFVGRSVGDSVECETLPAGLFFIATESEVQNIILLKTHVIWVGREETAFTLSGFCCESHDDAPDDEDRFTVGNVTNHAKMQELIDLVRDKDISGAVATVQLAAWEVIENNRLPRNYVDEINALPDDTMPPRGPQPAPDLGRRLKAER